MGGSRPEISGVRLLSFSSYFTPVSLSIMLICRNWFSFFFLLNSSVLSFSLIFQFFLLFSLSLLNPSIPIYLLCVSVKGPCLISWSDGGAFSSDVTLELYLLPISLSPSMEAESKVGISFNIEESWFTWSFKTVQMILWWWKDSLQGLAWGCGLIGMV